MEINEEKQLVKEWKKGNKEALSTLFKKYLNKFSSLAAYLSNSKEDAEDLLSETFIILLEKGNKFREKSSFFTYVYSIMTKLNLKKRRSKYYKIKLRQKLEKKVKSDNNTEVEKILKLREIIEKLPQLYKEILFLRYNQDLKESEISEILKIPVGTVKSRLSKAKKVLIKFWNKKWTKFNFYGTN